MIDTIVWVLLIVPAFVTLILVVELIAALFPARSVRAEGAPGIAIIIPAHDEEAGIAATMTGIRASAPEGARLIVVADNCSDRTAETAREAGAEVLERDDPDRRGKGFALAFARDNLAADPPDVVLIIDADCAVADDGIARLAATAWAGGRPVQSAYLLRPRPDLGAMVGLSGFAFLVRNMVRQRGLARLGAPALLTGSGMAFRWDVFAGAPLATADLAEDLALGAALARSGSPPVFLSGVATWSGPARRAATRAQRTRWEQGFLRVAMREAPSLLASGRWPLTWLGLHLLVPPLALLVLIDSATLVLLGWRAGSGGTAMPFTLLAGVLAGLLLLLGLTWLRFGRAQISGLRLLLIPLYIIWKVPIYLRALFRPERRWVRTDRD
ncbi:MAG: glycosyltransferase family 2 protein [Rhizorhabdus sp.]